VLDRPLPARPGADQTTGPSPSVLGSRTDRVNTTRAKDVPAGYAHRSDRELPETEPGVRRLCKSDLSTPIGALGRRVV